MKVLQLGKVYPWKGGIETVISDLQESLALQNIQCDLLASSTSSASEFFQTSEYSKIYSEGAWAKVLGTYLSPNYIFRLRRICNEYDIIHVHHPNPMAFIALFLSNYKGKVIVHWHSDILTQRIAFKLIKPLQNWALRHAHVIVCTSPIYGSMSPHLTKYQHKVINIPIGTTELKPDYALVEDIKTRFNGKKIVFTIGRLVPYKGFDNLIKSAQYLSDDYIILIGGKGPLFSDLLDLIKNKGLSEKVQLLGYLSDKDMPNYFAASDIFCLSSIWKTEAFAVVQIEAFSLGKPVVACDIPGSGVPWVNSHGITGLNVPIKQPQLLAEAITRITKNQVLYSEFSNNAKERFRKLFTKEQMITSFLKLYKKICVCSL